jgi:hypothetical protein
LIAEIVCEHSKHNGFKIMASGVRMGDLGAILLFSNRVLKTFPDKAESALSILLL